MALTQVSTSGIKDATVATADIAADAVTGAKIADDAVGAEHIEDLDANVKWLDSNKAVFGTGDDFQIYHNGTNNYLDTTGGHLYLRVNSTENAIKCTQNGNVEVSYDGSKKFETSSSGVTITGDANWNDNGKAEFGNAADLQIYHNGTDNLIDAVNGNTRLRVNDGEDAIKCVANGAVELYYDNSKKFETQSAGAQLFGNLTVGTDGGAIFLANPDGFSPKLQENAGSLEFYTNNNLRMSLGNGGNLLFQDNIKAEFGASSDLKIYHDGTESRVQASNGPLDLRTSTSHNVEILANDKYSFWGQADGMAALYHNGTRKFETTTNGATIDGGSNVSMDSSGNGQLKVNGSGYSGAIALDGTAMNIYHNSSSRGIIFGINETEKVRLQSGGGISFNGDTAAANALNDYEYGSWTPTYAPTGGVSGATYYTQTGQYVKIGRFVMVQFYYSISATTGSGNFRLSGLPYNANSYGAGSLMSHSLGLNSNRWYVIHTSNDGYIYLYGSEDNAAWETAVSDNSAHHMIGTISYYTAS